MKPTKEEIERAIQILDGADELTYRQIDALGTILAALADAQKDCERLDWLAINPEYINLMDFDEEPDKLRAAIDVGMKY